MGNKLPMWSIDRLTGIPKLRPKFGRMRLVGILYLALLVFIGTGNAQTISGTVKDGSTGELLIGVNVFNQESVGAATNIDG